MTTTGIQPTSVPEGIFWVFNFFFFSFVYSVSKKKRKGWKNGWAVGKFWCGNGGAGETKNGWMGEQKGSLCPLLRCCRVASATEEVTEGDGSSWEERSTGREQWGSVLVTEQESGRSPLGGKRKKNCPGGLWGLRSTERLEDKLMKQPVLRERVNPKPAVLPEWEEGNRRLWDHYQLPVFSLMVWNKGYDKIGCVL